jgi:uroporphyrin-III C-methyltransferase
MKKITPTVYLVGAGPGAADLITLRGARLLEQAQIVFYDALVDPAMLELCPSAVKVAVGKRCGKLSTAQKFIQKRMIDAAEKYTHIVRLKGGDPMLFGRADEELGALESAGINVEVVPGVTSAVAAAASLRQSLTLRGVSRSVAFVTLAKGVEEGANAHLTNVPNADTLVYYMGRRDAQFIAEQLIDSGRKGTTPVSIIEAISTKSERSLTLTLTQMSEGLASDWFSEESPALIMVGEALEDRVSKADLGLNHTSISKVDNGQQDVGIFTDGLRSA